MNATSELPPPARTARRRDDFSSLRCPVCKGRLAGGAELRCAACNLSFPVVGGVPVMLPKSQMADGEQDLQAERKFYEDMFAGVKGVEDGHCIVYGHDKIYDYVSEVERGTMLEAGCGGGHHGVALTRRGFDVTAVDLTLNGVAIAKRLAEHEKQDILYVCGDIKRLPFEDNAFDICFASLVLHHFISLDNLLAELARVTRKHFIAFEVNAWDPMTYVRFNVLNPTIGYESISKNQRALFPETIVKILVRNGFSPDVDVRYESMHDNIGKAPDSLKSAAIRAYHGALGMLPAKFSANKFLLRATKTSAGR